MEKKSKLSLAERRAKMIEIERRAAQGLKEYGPVGGQVRLEVVGSSRPRTSQAPKPAQPTTVRSSATAHKPVVKALRKKAKAR